MTNQELLILAKECVFASEMRENIFYDTVLRDPSTLRKGDEEELEELSEDEEDLVLYDELMFEEEDHDYLELKCSL